MKNTNLLIPAAFVLRWMEESPDMVSFKARFEQYVNDHRTNWEIPLTPSHRHSGEPHG